MGEVHRGGFVSSGNEARPKFQWGASNQGINTNQVSSSGGPYIDLCDSASEAEY